MPESMGAADAAMPGQGMRIEIDLASNDPEDLTSMTLRALRKADVILHDSEVSPAILGYARRDARHMRRDAGDGAEVSGWAGLRVVVLHSPHSARRAVAGGGR